MTTDDFTNITPIPEGSDIIEPPEIGHKAEACSPDEPAEDAAAKRPWRVTYLGAIIAVALLVALVSIIGAVSRTQGRANAARAHVVAGQSALVDGDRDSALYEFTEALRLDPRIPGANKALGQIALANGRADEAIRHYETELKINPNDRQSHIALGCLYSLGVIPPDDPHALRGYLLQRFTDIAPAEYSPNLTYTAPEGTDPLALSIYHYQFAAHGHPEDPSPAIGAALTHLAD
jgi:tetratricopeptide (TPR) repeat protein